MTEFTKTRCCVCDIEFHVPRRWLDHKASTAGDVWCPNGHRLSYTESDADRLRRERDLLKQAQARIEDEKRQERERADSLQRRLSAQFGENTKLRKRLSHGVCPCCNRQFKNLQSHMAQKHPTFARPAAERLADNVVPIAKAG